MRGSTNARLKAVVIMDSMDSRISLPGLEFYSTSYNLGEVFKLSALVSSLIK